MNDKIFRLYNELYEIYGNSANAVKARNSKQQYLRFRELINLIELKNNDKVLDVGCGLGDLSKYLRERKFNVQYLGVDFVDGFIKTAKKKYENDKTKFLRLDIKNKNFPKKHDWLILSGLFNDQKKNAGKFMFKIIKKMFKSANKGIVFNGLNKYVDYEDKYLFYSYPDKVLQFCIKNLSKYVILKTNYQLKKNTIPFEYTIAVFKK